MTPEHGPLVLTAIPGPRSRELGARLASRECPAFDARRAARGASSGEEQAPVVFERGEGELVWDVDGNRYVDLVGGFGALVLGHAPAALTAALVGQLGRLPLALGDVFPSEAKVRVCEAIAALYPAEGARVLLGLSGADAVTAAMKTAVLATGRPGVVAFEGAYHGLSHGPLAACGLSPAFRAPFAGQLGERVTFAPYPRADARDPARALDASLSSVRAALAGGEVGLVLVEPLLGRGGCLEPPPGFLRELRALCTESGALLAADEIWTGLGRSGALLASLAECTPDLVCLGKGLGAGYPISACVGSAGAMEAWGAHGGAAIHTATHFGAPPACEAALVALGEIERLGLAARARQVGAALQRALRAAGFTVTGRGLMLGVHLGSAPRALAVARRLLRRGWLTLTGGTSGDVLTLSPPLILSEARVAPFVAALQASHEAAPGARDG
ncbi:MAG TPA: aspartate aminotransferase family protein [Polyangiaceae bacterium]|nr:aspartate aminotransferase family protein [Polyangiaceae bacterium]